jgi:hypothetical protein
MSRSITINTVTAPPFTESMGRETMTPRLHLEVYYDEGGVSMLTYRTRPRAYVLAVKYDRLSDSGFKTILLDAIGFPAATLEPAKRFSAAKLAKFAADIRDGKYDELIDSLYARAVKGRHEHQWPETIRSVVAS